MQVSLRGNSQNLHSAGDSTLRNSQWFTWPKSALKEYLGYCNPEKIVNYLKAPYHIPGIFNPPVASDIIFFDEFSAFFSASLIILIKFLICLTFSILVYLSFRFD